MSNFASLPIVAFQREDRDSQTSFVLGFSPCGTLEDRLFHSESVT